MKRKKKKTKSYSGKNLIVLAIAVVVFGVTIMLSGTRILANVSGWAKGIWNNYVEGHAENDPNVPPTIGWLSSSNGLSVCNQGASYKLSLAGIDGDNERTVRGAAWFGIGSEGDVNSACQTDSPSLGWLNFDQGSPSFCQQGNMDCFPAKWKKKGGGNGLEGTISGWAQITSMMAMPKSDGSTAQNGWVRIYGAPVASDGVVYDDGSTTGNGSKTIYAWNSGEETTIPGNSGLGWISLEGLKISDCPDPCATFELCPTEELGEKGTSCDSALCRGIGACTVAENKKDWYCDAGCGQVRCPYTPINPEPGECGSADGTKITDPDKELTDAEKCKKGKPSPITENGIFEIRWTCGEDACHEHVSVECSAGVINSWIETNPS